MAALQNEITKDGTLLEWHLNIKTRLPGVLIIWRKVTTNQQNYNVVYLRSYDLSVGYHVLNVTSQQFAVIRGDLIGFGANNGVAGSIGFDYNSGPKYSYKSSCSVTLGKTLDIRTGQLDRNYAIGAVYGSFV